MLLPSILAVAVLSGPMSEPITPRATFDSVVPGLPGGYATGQVSLDVYSVEMTRSSSPGLLGDLASRTGVTLTEMTGLRIEVMVPDQVRFESLEAHVVDGLVLEPEQHSFIGRCGNALVGLLRILLVGRLISAADDLAVPGAVWAVAVGAPSTQDEIVRLSTSDMLKIDRDASAFSDHGSFAVCRAMLALSPWTELIDIRVSGLDLTTGKRVGWVISRLPLYPDSRTGRRQKRQVPVDSDLVATSTGNPDPGRDRGLAGGHAARIRPWLPLPHTSSSRALGCTIPTSGTP